MSADRARTGPFIPALVLAGLGLLMAAPAHLFGNGGTLRIANVAMGDYLVSVFTDPTPVRPDSLDVSVLVLREGRPGLAEDVEVRVRARSLDHPGPEVVLEATRDQADDPRYHAAKFALGHEGRWSITVEVSGEHGSGSASFEVRAREAGLLGHPLVLSLLALLPLAVMGWWVLREDEEEGGVGGRTPTDKGPGGLSGPPDGVQSSR